ncbi:MAG TPA: metallopeptidase family protein [Caulobacteraceae bacterium]|jgi:predicted Zn-dependent protease with MMP-like domain|nr:metallopeptidase family protein [Caulobacteraceae bacterium]
MNKPPTTDWADLDAPSLKAFAALAEAIFGELPARFRQFTGDVVFRVQDFAEPEVLAELGLEDPFELSGLYQGVSRVDRSVLATALMPSTVFLYRRPILDEWAERGDVTLAELVAHVLIHEIGHHFGLSDDDIDTIQAD